VGVASAFRIDFHVHTRYSRDCKVSPSRVVEIARSRGLTHVVITDHNSIEGALEAKAAAPDFVIVGEEVATETGELLAFFIHEQVPKGLSLEETVRRIRGQGGIVGVSHPLDRLRREAIGRKALEPILGLVDCLEVFNARVILRSDNERARALAQARDLPGTAGSDAHSAREIGRAYVELLPFGGPHDFIQSLREGKVVGRLSSPFIHLISTVNKLRK
jgi:predicted metal-dependent phosphoesterase TrpH